MIVDQVPVEEEELIVIVDQVPVEEELKVIVDPVSMEEPTGTEVISVLAYCRDIKGY